MLGRAFDVTGSHESQLMILAVALGIAALLNLALPNPASPYRRLEAPGDFREQEIHP
jgi:hypothetical protein